MPPFPGQPPFASRPSSQQEQPERPDPETPAPQYPRDDLLRLGGLYPSRTGKALMGNVRVSEPRRGANEPFGVVLIDLITQAMEEKRPLRLLVFDNSNSRYPNSAPYTVHATLGNGRPQEAASEPPPPPTPQAPPARPTRRTAPRR